MLRYKPLFFSKKRWFLRIIKIIFHSAVAFQQYQIYQILLNVPKVLTTRKIIAMNKKCTLFYLK